MKLTMDAADERQTKYEEFAAAVDREYQLKKSAQDRLAANLSRISPAGALMFASMSLARTGLDEHQRFVDAVRQYWPIWYKWSDSKIREPTEPGPPGGKLDLLNMPQFTDRPEGIGLSLRRALPDYGIMGFMIILFFAGAYWSFVRYDVR